jgi:histidinol phosphatase-like PHP family hydrolase
VAVVSNLELAELLARKSEDLSGTRQRALKRAARSAFLWPEEAATLLTAGRSLTELYNVGPFIAHELADWIENPPEPAAPDPLRHDFLTLAQARIILARSPAWKTKLRSDLHMHTNWSDGSGSVAEMAEAGRGAGYEYISITDHAKGLKIAGGIDEAQISEQAVEIASANEAGAAAGCTVLHSIELNLNPKGEGDLDAECLRKLDLVLGSFHSALRSKDDQTERYLAALRNPTVHILGHPRVRVYNYRLGLSADWPRVFAEAAKLDKALEIDCYPDRQDLNVDLLKLAEKAGCRVSLGTDAHHSWQLSFIELGLAAALEAGIRPDRVVNFMALSELRGWVAGLRRR